MKLKFKILFNVSLLAFCLTQGCKKNNDTPSIPSTCDVKGDYGGTYTNQFGQTASHSYRLGENNFMRAANIVANLNTPNGFGSYKNTCDSIYIMNWSSTNNNYYKLSGKFNSDRTTITGIYINLSSPSETGPFALTKQ